MEDEGEDEKEGRSGRLQTLFDFYWFETLILHQTPPPPPLSPPSPPPPPPPPPPESKPEVEPPPIAQPSPLLLRRHRRSLSDELNSSSSSSPLLIRPPPRLQTILSGKESESDAGLGIDGGERRWRRGRSPCRSDRRGRRRGKSSRSLSDLEFEEVKGFIDLGFTFSEADSDPRLMSIVPGLQRLRPAAAAKEGSPPLDEGDGGVSRPYLSEAWDDDDDEEKEKVLREWKIPAVEEGVDLKDHLRFWAHAVASAVR